MACFQLLTGHWQLLKHPGVSPASAGMAQANPSISQDLLYQLALATASYSQLQHQLVPAPASSSTSQL